MTVISQGLSARGSGDSFCGRIVNRVGIPDGTATVCVERLHRTKVGHWIFSEKAVGLLGCVSQETCLAFPRLRKYGFVGL